MTALLWLMAVAIPVLVILSAFFVRLRDGADRRFAGTACWRWRDPAIVAPASSAG